MTYCEINKYQIYSEFLFLLVNRKKFSLYFYIMFSFIIDVRKIRYLSIKSILVNNSVIGTEILKHMI